LPSYPPEMKAMMDKSMTKQEYELKRAEEDMIVENAEVCCYLMMIQKCQMAGGVYANAIDPLSQIMKDEQNQSDWIKSNSPVMLAQLWPKIQSAVAANAPPFSL
jgi:ferritin-like metal-binding protein YciE